MRCDRDARRAQLRHDHLGELRQTLSEHGRKLGPGLEGGRDHAQEMDFRRASPAQLADQKHFLDPGLMGGELERDAVEAEILPGETTARAGRVALPPLWRASRLVEDGILLTPESSEEG